MLNQMDLVLAILKEIARQRPGLETIPRQVNAVINAADEIVHQFSIGEIKETPGQGIDAWRKTDQVGASSDFMAAVLGNAGQRPYAHPRDPGDFRRCLSLLNAAPELRQKLPEMAAQSPQWAALVDHWYELEDLWYDESLSGNCPKLYTEMRRLYGRIKKAAT